MQKSLLLAIAFLALLFAGCKKDDNTNPNNNNNNNNPVDTTGNPIDTTGNNNNQYLNWLKQTLQVQYAADGVTEQYKTVSTYDAQGRITGSSTYSQNVKIFATRDYVYTGNQVVLYTDNYTNGSVSSSQKTVATNYKYWFDYGTVTTYMPDGVTEKYKQVSTFDANNRRTNIKAWQNGVLSSEVKDYVYNGNEYTCNSVGYTNGVATSTTKLKYSSYKDFLRLNFYVSYKPDGITESYRQETTYDGSERKIGTKTYLNGVLSNETDNYTYNGTEATYYSYTVQNGVRGPGTKGKEVYLNQ
jgi:hypothetical protein